MRRLRLAALVGLLCFLVPLPAYCFIGNIKIGGVKLPCAVACGGSRGVVNLNFAGDAINSFLTGPSIDNFAEKANQSIDRGLEKFEKLLIARQSDFLEKAAQIATDQREQFIVALSATTDEAVAQLDSTLRQQLRDADRILETRLGTLDVVLDKNTRELGSTLKRFVIFCIVVGALSYITWSIYRRKYVDKLPLQPMLPRLSVALVMFVALGSVLYVLNFLNDVWSRQQLVTSMEEGYEKALSSQIFDYAVYYSAQLVYLDRYNELYQARQEKAELLRDVFARPALYRSADGARELLNRLGNAQKAFKRISGQYDRDLTILYGFATWQRGDDRFSEYAAANIMSEAISGNASQGIEQPTLLPIAYYYLSAYLADPIPDSMIASLYAANAGIDPSDVFISGQHSSSEDIDFQRRTVQQLTDVSHETKVDLESLAKVNSLYAFVRVSLEGVSTYRKVVSGYGELLRLSGELISVQDSQKPSVRNEIRTASHEIVAAWASYIKFLGESSYADQTAKLNSFRGLWPIYTYALGATAISDADLAITPVAQTLGIQEVWLSEVVQPSVRASAFRLITAATSSDYKATEVNLAAVQAATKAFFDAVNARKPLIGSASAEATTATSNVISAGAALSLASAKVGLFACEPPNASARSVVCAADNPKAMPLGTLLFKMIAGLDDKSISSVDATNLIIGYRSIPAF
jgi:hypothetical protein